MGGNNTGKKYLGTSKNATREKIKGETVPRVKPAKLKAKVENNLALQRSINYLSRVMEESGITAETDCFAYEILVQRIKEYYVLHDLINDPSKPIYKIDDDGDFVASPILEEFHNSEKLMMDMLREFGLTPLKRGKIVRAKVKQKKDEWDL